MSWVRWMEQQVAEGLLLTKRLCLLHTSLAKSWRIRGGGSIHPSMHTSMHTYLTLNKAYKLLSFNYIYFFFFNFKQEFFKTTSFLSKLYYSRWKLMILILIHFKSTYLHSNLNWNSVCHPKLKFNLNSGVLLKLKNHCHLTMPWKKTNKQTKTVNLRK